MFYPLDLLAALSLPGSRRQLFPQGDHMAKITWLGEDDLHDDDRGGPRSTIFYGIKFLKGEAVEVDNPAAIKKASGNRFFKVNGPDDEDDEPEPPEEQETEAHAPGKQPPPKQQQPPKPTPPRPQPQAHRPLPQTPPQRRR
jgi:hypothetical protein